MASKDNVYMGPNEHGMTPRMYTSVKGKYYYFYDPNQLIKHNDIQEAKTLLNEIGMKDESFLSLLYFIWNWKNAEFLQVTKEDYEARMRSAADHVKKAYKIILKHNVHSKIPKLRDVISYANARICKKVNDGNSKIKVDFFEFNENDTSINASIITVMEAIDKYFSDSTISDFWQLEHLRMLQPGDTRNVRSYEKETIVEKKEKKGGVKVCAKRLVMAWIYIHLKNLGEHYVSGDNKNIIITKIASALLGEEVKPGAFSSMFPEQRDAYYLRAKPGEAKL